MSLTRTTFEYTGGPQVFNTNFALGVLEADHVKVTLDGLVDSLGDPVYLDRTYNPVTGQVTIEYPLDEGDTGVIFREVPTDQLIVDFEQGADVTRRNLVRSIKQALMAVQEAVDGREADSQLIQQTVININEIADTITDEVQDTIDNAELALQYRNAAQTFSLQAGSSASAAATSATNAGQSETNAGNHASTAQSALTGVTDIVTGSDFTTVVALETDIQTVAASSTAIQTVAPVANTLVDMSPNVEIVAGIAGEVEQVAGFTQQTQFVAQKYQGALSSNPTFRTLDGTPIQSGDFYLNVVDGTVRFFANPNWVVMDNPPELSPAQVTNASDPTFGSVSGERLAEAFDAREQQIGVGQTWHDMRSERTFGVAYQNTTGRPIVWNFRSDQNVDRGIQVSEDGATWLTVARTSGSSFISTSVVVPDQWFYRVSDGSVNIGIWAELR